MYSKTNSPPKINSFFPSSNIIHINQQVPSRTPNELENIRDLLNSQRIKLLFGNYAVELVLQEGNFRVSNLHSNHVMRTCAMVNFSLPVPAWLKDTHDKIYLGSSIGQTIKEGGFNLTKEDAYFGITKLPAFAKDKMQTDETSAAVHIYQLDVKHPETSESIHYCTITEVHSPLYLTIGDLRQLYPQGAQKHSTVTNSVQKCLDSLNSLDEWLTNSHRATKILP